MPVNLSAAIYGTLTVGALLAAESAQSETYLETFAAVVLALFVYLLAHAYSEFASHRLERGEPFTFAGLAQALSRSAWILLGAALPFITLLVDWVAGVNLTTGVTLAIWSAAVTVLLLEAASALRAKQSGRDLVVQIAFGALMGFAIIVLRLVLH